MSSAIQQQEPKKQQVPISTVYKEFIRAFGKINASNKFVFDFYTLLDNYCSDYQLPTEIATRDEIITITRKFFNMFSIFHFSRICMSQIVSTACGPKRPLAAGTVESSKMWAFIAVDEHFYTEINKMRQNITNLVEVYEEQSILNGPSTYVLGGDNDDEEDVEVYETFDVLDDEMILENN